MTFETLKKKLVLTPNLPFPNSSLQSSPVVKFLTRSKTNFTKIKKAGFLTCWQIKKQLRKIILE